MKINKLTALVPVALALCTVVHAGPDFNFSQLNREREQVIRNYILDLGRADSDAISALFEEGGTVISTSRGNVNANDFFHAFLPEVASANTEFHQLFTNQANLNRYAARFSFNFKLNDGEVGNGEYVDEFIFNNNSSKLSSVYMFENLKFDKID